MSKWQRARREGGMMSCRGLAERDPAERRKWQGLLLVCCLSVGCGPAVPTGEIIPTVPAAGVLSFNGKALAYYQVTVVPDGDRPAVGISDETGRFVLGTNGPDDGAVAGRHRVAVHYVGPPSNDPDEGMNTFTPPPPPDVRIPRKYTRAESSGLSIDVPPVGDVELQIEIN